MHLKNFHSTVGSFEDLLKLMMEVIAKLLATKQRPTEEVVKHLIEEFKSNQVDDETKSTTSNSDKDETYPSLADEPSADSIQELLCDFNSSHLLDENGRLGMKDRMTWRCVCNSTPFASMVTQHFHR